MTHRTSKAFLSYSREDSDFALRLARDLRTAGAAVWLDQLDIRPGERWDRSVEDALAECSRMLVILSPSSMASTHVLDEVSFALEEQKTVIPAWHLDCKIPFRLRRLQYVDCRSDYDRGLKEILTILLSEEVVGAPAQRAQDSAATVQSPGAEASEKQQRERASAEEARRRAEQEQQERVAGEARRRAEQEQQEWAAGEARRKAEQEQQERVAVEARRKAEQERQEWAAGEARRKAEQEQQERVAVEARRKAEQEQQERVAVEARRKAEQEQQEWAAGEARRKAELEQQVRAAAAQREVPRPQASYEVASGRPGSSKRKYLSFVGVGAVALAIVVWILVNRSSSKTPVSPHVETPVTVSPDPNRVVAMPSYPSGKRLEFVDMINKTPCELDIMRNEPYARRGWIFDRPDLGRYFGRFEWYVPRYGPKNFPYADLSSVERHNIKFIDNYQKSTGNKGKDCQ